MNYLGGSSLSLGGFLLCLFWHPLLKPLFFLPPEGLGYHTYQFRLNVCTFQEPQNFILSHQPDTCI